jgi:Bacteriophage tail assembly protein
LKINDIGPGFVHYDALEAAGFSENFFKQLTAEVLVQTFERGRVIIKFVKIRERNEALDCAIYATAGLELLNPNFDFLQEFYARGGIANAPARAKRPPSKGISL